MSTIIDFVKFQDRRFLYLFNRSMKCEPLDIIMHTVTQLGSLPVAIAVPILLLLSENPKLEAVGRTLALVLIISQTVVHILKWLVNRPRPFKVLDNIIARYPPATRAFRA